MQVTAERARELLDYNPETGMLVWKVYRNPMAQAGFTVTSVCNNGYTVVGIDGKVYQAHRVAWLIIHGCWPPEQLDHENRIRTDNRLLNLRVMDIAGNMKNKSKARNNTSGHTGVYQTKHGNWIARIASGRKQINLGTFDTIEAAVAARQAANAAHNFHSSHGL